MKKKVINVTYRKFGDFIGFAYVASMLVISGITLSISNWFSLKNKDKE